MINIDDIIQEANTNGLTPQLISLLKELRPYFKDVIKDPLVTKLLRMSYQHIEKTGGYKIKMLSKVEEEIDENGEPIPVVESGEPATEVEEFVYMMELMKKADHHLNREELSEIRDMFKASGQK